VILENVVKIQPKLVKKNLARKNLEVVLPVRKKNLVRNLEVEQLLAKVVNLVALPVKLVNILRNLAQSVWSNSIRN